LLLINSNEFPAQALLEPVAISLSPKEIATALEHQASFENFGFEFEVKQDDGLMLLAVPLILKGPTDFAFFTELLAKLETGGENSPTVQIREELAMIACKAAVKGSDVFSMIEASALIDRLLALDNPYTCPHGRPTMVRLTRKEIEKMFKRT
ncbi:MAG: DNA mismatch repair protein MutL, partial [Defluviitaleaceae bacterium]|nr:DNA mismatch repair protein MutL [Defluviitaleaceae bacterium]